MIKLFKLIKYPKKIWLNSRPDKIVSHFKNRNLTQPIKNKRTVAFMFNFSPWKDFMGDFFPEYDMVFVKPTKRSTFLKIMPEIAKYRDVVFLIWGYKDKDCPIIARYAKQYSIPIYRVEDGFLRSVNLGATKERPISLVLDKRSIHFDANNPSDLEQLLNTYNFRKEPELLKHATNNINKLKELRISKYNLAYNNKAASRSVTKSLDKRKKNILVLGQVEEDASIEYGCHKSINNLDLVKLAAIENPSSNIIFKPHPDVLLGYRNEKTKRADIESFATVIETDIHEAINLADHVYTISSLSGFEALLYGKKVTVLGCPFYSGWGLTDDRQPNPRRKRTLTIEKLFAIAYMVYPRYISLDQKGKINLSDAIDELSALSKHHNNVIKQLPISDAKKVS